ncbi:MAG: hypothetical protein ACRDFZ_04995 [Candidatus Limnocylindria bacterium]
MLQPTQLDDGIKDSRERLGLKRRFDLGILLVHGIGEQVRGDVLTEEGDRIFGWLRRRVERPEGPGGPGEPGGEAYGDVDVLDVVARQLSADNIPAAHAVVRIAPPAGKGKTAHWVVAESLWSEVFRQATFSELAGWAVTIGPWVFATQVAGIWRRMEIGESVPRLLRLLLVPITLLVGTVMLVGAAVVGLLVTALALGLFVLSVVPIPFVSGVARALQRALANGFGDAYVLTRSPIRFGAMATQVHSDMQVLLRECASVAIVAHSQGAAVSWYALQHELLDRPAEPPKGEARPAPIGLFLTYGQGVRKLTFVLTMARGSQTGLQTLAAVGSAADLLLAGWALVAGAPWPLAAAFGILAIIAEFFLLSSAIPIWERAGKEMESDWQQVVNAEPNLEWLDLWASADPAPVGPLDVSGKQVRSYKIRNLSSFVLDHFTYWRNPTEFIAIVASRLFGLGGPQLYAATMTDPRLQVAAMRRHARVLMLLAMRVFLIGGVLAGLIHAWFTPEFGGALMEFIGDLNLAFVDEFFDAPPDWAIVLAGFAGVIVIAAIAWLPISLGWNALTGADEDTYLRGVRRPLWSPAWQALGLLALVLIGMAVALLNLAQAELLAWVFLFGSPFAALLCLTVLASGGSTFAGTEDSQSPMVATRKITGQTSSSVAVAAVIALILVLVPIAAAFLVPDAIGWILAAEAALLSAVLAAEGIREYRLFRVAFNSRNAKLPESEPQS